MPARKRYEWVWSKEFLFRYEMSYYKHHYRIYHNLIKHSSSNFKSFLLVQKTYNWIERKKTNHAQYKAFDVIFIDNICLYNTFFATIVELFFYNYNLVWKDILLRTIFLNKSLRKLNVIQRTYVLYEKFIWYLIKAVECKIACNIFY
jgi:hypothetical protein